MTALREGMTVGHLVLVAPVQPPTTGEAWLARDGGEPAARTLVLRPLSDEVVGNAQVLSALRDDARIARSFEHPHLIRLEDVTTIAGRWYLLEEHVVGRTLRQIKTRADTLDRVLPIWFTLHVVATICRALAFVHARCGERGSQLAALRQVVTCDTVAVTFAGDPKLAIFGLARYSLNTRSAMRPITIDAAYAAPELLGDTAQALSDLARADAYSVGVLLYELLTGRRPYQVPGEESIAAELRAASGDPPPPSTIARWVTEPLEDIVLTALARDPKKRFANATELREALEQYMAWAGVQPARKHVAAQVAGVPAGAESEPPPSARSIPMSGPPPRQREVELMPSALEESGEVLSPAAVWDRLIARRRTAESSDPPAPLAQRGATPAHPDPVRHGWDRAVERVRASPRPEPLSSDAVQCFEAGLELARGRDYRGALAMLERAVALKPENRLFLTNLRRLRERLRSG